MPNMKKIKKIVSILAWILAIGLPLAFGAGLMIDPGPTETFRTFARSLEGMAFVAGYAAGMFAAYSLYDLLPQWIQDSTDGVWFILAFIIHPIPSLILAYFFTLPFHAWT